MIKYGSFSEGEEEKEEGGWVRAGALGVVCVMLSASLVPWVVLGFIIAAREKSYLGPLEEVSEQQWCMAGRCVVASNAYERRIAPLQNSKGLVLEVNQWTRIRSDGRCSMYAFGVETKQSSPGGCSLEVLASKPGKERLWVAFDEELVGVELFARYVRRDVADLAKRDLSAYLDALQILYRTDGEEGRRKFGHHFRSGAELTRFHLACRGAVFEFERSLQAVDARTAAHYATDASKFKDDAFGRLDYHYTVDTGRWAFQRVRTDARHFGPTNAYGVLRWPWDTSKGPYVGRSDKVFGAKTKGRIGGIWNFVPELEAREADLVEWLRDLSTFRELTRTLYIAGVSKCPEFCAADLPERECACVLDPALQNESPYDILDRHLVFQHHFPHLQKGRGQDPRYEWLLAQAVNGGHPGIADANDPAFWILAAHPDVEGNLDDDAPRCAAPHDASPFAADLLDFPTNTPVTNAQFDNLTSTFSIHLPYIYDRPSAPET